MGFQSEKCNTFRPITQKTELQILAKKYNFALLLLPAPKRYLWYLQENNHIPRTERKRQQTEQKRNKQPRKT